MGKRKIIQVVTGHHQNYDHALYALCDDGTLWVATWSYEADRSVANWELVNSIPQPEEGE